MSGASRLHVRLVGTVQGVGFRPFVHRLAEELSLAGWVRNDGDGVTVEVEGSHDVLLSFLTRLQVEAPPAAMIYACEHRFLPYHGFDAFEIRHSEGGGPLSVWILPDLATCPACRDDVLRAGDRRHRYPFTNCTHCGPRFTIVDGLPYDRERTSMRSFPMCPECSTEYSDPADRRFHAQPNACPVCGPRLTYRPADVGRECDGDPALREAVTAIASGAVVAVKGIGGFHLLADARNESAIAELRRRKRRSRKAFAVMYPNLETLRRHVEVPSFAGPILASTQAPIVLLQRTEAGRTEIAPSVAPGSPYLGVFLPYTPLHTILLADLGHPVVATSGNLSDEPIHHRDDDARTGLDALCDGWLLHDRDILRPADDSVLHVVARPRPRPQMLRRARGYAPLPILAPRPVPTILAVGGQMNVTFAVAREREILLSQHLGDMEGFESREAYRRCVEDFLRLYERQPTIVAHDLHPDYFTTRFAESLPGGKVAVQHHHAHLAACMLENEIDGTALGLTWDGTGHGPDGTVWGGEALLGGPASYRRVASLHPFRLPGGEWAIREPWRVGVALLRASLGDDWSWDLPFLRGLRSAEVDVVDRMLARDLRSPVTTSMGRLFDGMAAILNLSTHNSHQAESAQALEYAAWRHGRDARPLPVEFVEDGDVARLDWRPLVRAAVEAYRAGASPDAVAASFHHAIARAGETIASEHPEAPVVLAGGVFCNRYLTELMLERFQGAGRDAHVHGQLPPTDGSLAVGQLWVAAHRE